ncbi:hypothetical protein [Xenorhabdus littoralis]|nr:hypothetical protein [Xenorhabdus sp. psl]
MSHAGILKTSSTTGDGERHPKVGGCADERDAQWRYSVITLAKFTLVGD